MSDNATLIQTLIQAYNHQDAEQFAANATEDCETLDVPGGMTFRGPDGLRHYIQENLSAFPDGQIQATSLFTTDDDGLLEVIGRGTNTGPLMSPMGPFPPTGRRAELRYCIVHRFRNGKIASLHFFYDRLSLLQQLGLIPAPGQAS